MKSSTMEKSIGKAKKSSKGISKSPTNTFHRKKPSTRPLLRNATILLKEKEVTTLPEVSPIVPEQLNFRGKVSVEKGKKSSKKVSGIKLKEAKEFEIKNNAEMKKIGSKKEVVGEELADNGRKRKKAIKNIAAVENIKKGKVDCIITPLENLENNVLPVLDKEIRKKTKSLPVVDKEIRKKKKLAKITTSKVLPPPPALIKENVMMAVAGLRKLMVDAKKKKAENAVFKQLFDTDAEPCNDLFVLQVTCSKFVRPSNRGTTKPVIIKVRLPHSLYHKEKHVCLITKDIQKGKRVNTEPTLQKYQELLQQSGSNSLVNEVIPLRQFKSEYHDFEAKRQLVKRVDFLLCDASVYRLAQPVLGKSFARANKMPIKVNLNSKNLADELEKSLSASVLLMRNTGTCSAMQVGHFGQSDKEVAENIFASMESLATKFPGGFINIRNLTLKSTRDVSNSGIPIFVNLGSRSKIPNVKLKIKKQEIIEGELSTSVSGLRVKVFPEGRVDVVGEDDLIRQDFGNIEKRMLHGKKKASKNEKLGRSGKRRREAVELKKKEMEENNEVQTSTEEKLAEKEEEPKQITSTETGKTRVLVDPNWVVSTSGGKMKEKKIGRNDGWEVKKKIKGDAEKKEVKISQAPMAKKDKVGNKKHNDLEDKGTIQKKSKVVCKEEAAAEVKQKEQIDLTKSEKKTMVVSIKKTKWKKSKLDSDSDVENNLNSKEKDYLRRLATARETVPADGDSASESEDSDVSDF